MAVSGSAAPREQTSTVPSAPDEAPSALESLLGLRTRRDVERQLERPLSRAKDLGDELPGNAP